MLECVAYLGLLSLKPDFYNESNLWQGIEEENLKNPL